MYDYLSIYMEYVHLGLCVHRLCVTTPVFASLLPEDLDFLVYPSICVSRFFFPITICSQVLCPTSVCIHIFKSQGPCLLRSIGPQVCVSPNYCVCRSGYAQV